MLKLLKYEIKGQYRMTAALLVGIIVINFLAISQGSRISHLGLWMVSLVLCVLSVTLSFVFAVESFNNDVYMKNGYLLFTLPQKSIKIIGSKLIFAVLQLWMLLCMSAVFLYVNGKRCEGYKLEAKIWNILNEYIYISLMFIFLLVMVYFCTAIANSIIKRKKIGKTVTFIVVITFLVLLTKVNTVIANYFPKAITNFRTICITSFSGNHVSGIVGYVNTAVIIVNGILLVAIFAVTVYLMDKKMEF